LTFPVNEKLRPGYFLSNGEEKQYLIVGSKP
jgi:hypothetical protein